MLAARVIPCLDVRDGRVVKGVRFQGLRDAGDPVERARAYEAQGADELVLLDVSATPDGRRTAVDVVSRVRRELSIPLTVGGGVRAIDDAARLLEAGADKVAVNSAAVERPALIAELRDRFGAQCAILALDAARVRAPAAPGDATATATTTETATEAAPLVEPARWEVVTQSGKHRTGLDALAWARQAAALGAGEVLLTSWDRDGTRAGYDLALIAALARAVDVPIIASGGAAHADHLYEALEAGADAVLAASIFHDGETTVGDVKRALAARGVRLRADVPAAIAR
jgi:imidazoleglycerol phosphate synthase cyclase subunit